MKTNKTLAVRLFTLFFLFGKGIGTPAQTDPSNVNLSPIASERLFVAIGSEGADAQFTFVNYGRVAARSFHYTLTETGTLLEEKDMTLPQPIAPGESGKLTLRIRPGKKRGLSDLILTLLKVNGYDNRATFNFTTLERATVTKVPVKRVVMEDFTATWCPYCPRATAVLENLAHQYPDTFIGIAVHASGDPMYCTAYGPSSTYGVSGLPTVLVGRRSKVASFTGEDEYLNEMRKGTEVGMEVSAVWDQEKKNISVSAQTTFCIVNPSASYALAYVLVADGLKGQGGRWAQANNYSGLNGYLGISSYLDFYIKSGTRVQGIAYNHVAIMGEGIERGIPGSVSMPTAEDETQTHRTTLRNIDGYTVIQDKSKLHVIVLLIDTRTKAIVNAAKCGITDTQATGIDEVSAQRRPVEVARYTASGQRIAAPRKGVNIVKYSDGRVEKQAVE